MTRHIQELLNFYIYEKKHHTYRRQDIEDLDVLADGFEKNKIPDYERAAKRLKYVLERETPVVFLHDRIAMLRTVPALPEIFTQKESDRIRDHHYIHEQGKICNINPDYLSLINVGFDEKRKEIENALCNHKGEQKAYLEAMLQVLDTISKFAKRYQEEAKKVGNQIVAEVFERIPERKPSSLIEALQFFRLIHYSLWCSFNYHNTIGRFDQFMLQYLRNDIEKGVLTKESALELLEEFFISFNKDSDLYMGMQQGDNGQSMVLGGLKPDGTDSYNLLSDLCMEASLELKLIDPKINLRVNKNTPLSIYEKGSLLTKQGLGFPQYLNDDIVIPALIRWGYATEDAYNYVTAACWEVIIPGYGMDIPNIDGFSFAAALAAVLPRLPECGDFQEFVGLYQKEIQSKCREMTNNYHHVYMEPSPLMSIMMKDCITNGRDVSDGNKYNNFGIHGTGLSTAVDSLASIKKYVFDEKTILADDLLEALNKNYEGYENLLFQLRYEGPKMGNDEDDTDQLAVGLLNCFADALSGIKNDRQGIYRAGTGSAMYYIWHSKSIQATPDGRKAGEEIACNFSPSLFSRCKGPISIIKSFSKPDLIKAANGGPLTMELHDTVFRNPEGIQKVAMLVKSYMDMGGHQMQLNAVNRETLEDAKLHPENYRNLIVRVWGWSGYFVELDEVYQDHIIKRMELKLQ